MKALCHSKQIDLESLVDDSSQKAFYFSGQVMLSHLGMICIGKYFEV